MVSPRLSSQLSPIFATAVGKHTLTSYIKLENPMPTSIAEMPPQVLASAQGQKQLQPLQFLLLLQ